MFQTIKCSVVVLGNKMNCKKIHKSNVKELLITITHWFYMSYYVSTYMNSIKV